MISLVLLIVLARIAMPIFWAQPANFSPLGAIALFSGAYFNQRRLMPFITVLLAVWLSDILINRIYLGAWVFFYPGFYWQYGSFMLITLMGTMLSNRVTLLNVGATSLLSAILFFIISNFGVWATWSLYPLTQAGLLACYVAAIPFFKYTLISNLFYGALLFGSFELMIDVTRREIILS
jgi:hypothetical protein